MRVCRGADNDTDHVDLDWARSGGVEADRKMSWGLNRAVLPSE